MAKTKRIKGTSRKGSKDTIKKMKDKYGDAVTLIQDIDRKAGSMTLHKRDHNRMIFWMALAGLNEYEMASVLGISDATLNVWKRNRPDFLAALNAGRKEAVATAAHSLFKVGNGFTMMEEKLIPNKVKEYDPDTGRVIKDYTEVMRVQVQKYYPPNVQALLKFLAAKHPEVWGDRSEVFHTSTISHSIDTTKLSKKKLKMLQEIAKSDMKMDKSEEKPTKRSKKKDKNKGVEKE